jgi:hypothetical protein
VDPVTEELADLTDRPLTSGVPGEQRGFPSVHENKGERHRVRNPGITTVQWRWMPVGTRGELRLNLLPHVRVEGIPAEVVPEGLLGNHADGLALASSPCGGCPRTPLAALERANARALDRPDAGRLS